MTITSIFIISASILGYGTKAWFTSQAQSGQNAFSAGTLKIQINDNGNWKKSDGGKIYNNFIMEPGQVKSVPLQVENTGTLDSSYRIRPFIKNAVKINNVSIMDVLRVKVTDRNANILFNGLFKDLNNGSINKNLDTVNGFLKSKSSDVMNFEFYLSGDAVGNNYQNLYAELGFNVDAVQYNRPKVDGLLSSYEYGYSKLDQQDISNTHSYIYTVDDDQYLYIFMKGYPTGNNATLTINELNSTVGKTKLIAEIGNNYSCSLKYEDHSPVPEDIAVVKAAEDSKFPNSGQVCFEYRIAKSALHPTDNAVTVTVSTSYGKNSTVKVTENKKYFLKK